MTDHPMQPTGEDCLAWLNEAQTSMGALRLAYAAGADAQLEACCEWLEGKDVLKSYYIKHLRAAMRPKPPSLAEQAEQELAALRIDVKHLGYNFRAPAIRRALERLAELEGQQDG